MSPLMPRHINNRLLIIGFQSLIMVTVTTLEIENCSNLSDGNVTMICVIQGPTASSTPDDFTELFSPLQYVMGHANSPESLSPVGLNQALISDTLSEFPNLSGFMPAAGAAGDVDEESSDTDSGPSQPESQPSDDTDGQRPPVGRNGHQHPNIISIGSTESQDVVIAYEVSLKGNNHIYL